MTRGPVTTAETIVHLHRELELLRSDLELYMQGYWRHEYYMTIGYNKIYTGNRIWISKNKK